MTAASGCWGAISPPSSHEGKAGAAVAPASAGSVAFSLLETLLLEGQRRHLGGLELEQHLLDGLQAMGLSLKGEAGPVLGAFRERQPRLQALGVLP